MRRERCSPNARLGGFVGSGLRLERKPVSAHFIQECPVCGRPLRISLYYGGWSLVCQHCHGRFVARDPADNDNSKASREDDLLHRASQLLAMAARLTTVPSTAEGENATPPESFAQCS
jgi:hypothetical protein